MPLTSKNASPAAPNSPKSSRTPRRGAAGSEQLLRLELDIARLFLAYGKIAVARRRLKRIVDIGGDTPTGVECRAILASLESQGERGGPDRHVPPRLASA